MAGKPGKTRRRSWVWRYRRLLFLACLLVFTALGGAAYLLVRVPLPPARPQAQTTFLTDANGVRLATLTGGVDRVAVRLGEVPKVVQDAVIATEDRNFFRHGGVDPVGILRATLADLRGSGGLQGGSTLTQQYVKNVYLGRERTFSRKVKEASLAVKLERTLTKRQILERYLNTIYFGRGAYGVQAAARAYFGKDVGQLGLPEAAYLASIIKEPARADPLKDPRRADVLRDATLAAMARTHAISPAQRAAAAARPVRAYVVDQAKAEPTFANAQDGTQYFAEYVRQQLVARYGEATILGGGLRVRTSLDLRMQHAAYQAVYGFLNGKDDPAGALVAVDGDGAVKAMVGGKDYGSTAPYAKVNLATGRDGGGSGRPAGSTFKPFLLAEIVREGYSVRSTFPAPARAVFPKADNGADYPVGNFDDESFPSPISLIDATKDSVNTVYAQAAMALGPSHLVDMAGQLGIPGLQPNLSLVLGSSEVSVLGMASAYSTFANRGERVTPSTILEVTAADGRVLERARPSRSRVLRERDADVVNYCLQKVVQEGTGVGAQFGKPMAGKTGTTDNFADAWFIGYTPKLTAAVWMGYPEGNGRQMLNVKGRKVNGGSFPATIFKRFMTAVERGRDDGGFPVVTDFPGRTLAPPSSVVLATTTTSTTATSTPSSSSTTSTSTTMSTTSTAPKPTSTSTAASGSQP